MMARGERSKTFVTAAAIASSPTLAVPKVSTRTETGSGTPDRIGEFEFAAIREPGGDDILGHVAGHVGGRSVDLRGVLAGEGAAAVPAHAAIAVHDDLATGKSRVACRSSDDEAPRRVDEVARFRVEEARRPQYGLHDFFDESFADLLVADDAAG